MTKVLDHYYWVVREYGQEIGSKFYRLIKAWDKDSNDVMNAFYSNDLLMQLTKEAQE